MLYEVGTTFKYLPVDKSVTFPLATESSTTGGFQAVARSDLNFIATRRRES